MSLQVKKSDDSKVVLVSRVKDFRKKRTIITALEEGGFVVTSRDQLPDLIPRTVAIIPILFLKKLKGQPRFIFEKKDLQILSASIKEGGGCK